MNLDTLESFGIHDDNIAAYSAEWADHEMIIGGSYSGGAYLASTAGKLTSLAGLQEEAVYIVRQMKDKVYYNTNFDGTLKVLNLATKEKKSLDINNVHGLYPAPDGNQMLVLQDNGSKKTMILCDADGGNIQTIAEGVEIGGISWSPDQQLIAYSMKAVVNGATVKGLYVYDMLTGKENQIVVDVESPATSWSPSGRELAYMEWNGVQYDSSIVYLNYSLQK
jgi:TolB protein